MKKLLFFLIVVALISTFNSCKKDVEEIAEAAKMKLIERLDKLDVPEAMRNSSNSNAQTAVGYVDMVKGVASYFSWFDVPEDAVNEKSATISGDEVYFWTYMGTSVWETYTETSSGYVWQIDIDSGTGKGRQKYMYSEETKDGSYGILEIYDIEGESGNYVFMYEWTFDSKDNATLTWKDYEESFVYEVKSNANLSGSAQWWAEKALIYNFVWNTDGSGSYEFYGDDGSVLFSESWSVEDL